jgi:phosphoenolpyruvate carboxylase
MSLTKSFFELTAYMKEDPEFGDFWKIRYKEYLLSKNMILKLTGFSDLMENEQAGKASIEIREEIVQPLLTIQQFALINIRENKSNPNFDKKKIDAFKRIVTRSLFGNINASRNSA